MNDIYNNNLNRYFKSIINTKYLFEITKCCGYSEFISVYKEFSTTDDLYKTVINQFHMNALMHLWVVNDQTGERLLIPRDENINLRDFIINNNNYFRAIYSLPASVVYKIYFDDSACHNHDDINNINNNICSPCVLHT